MRKVILLVMAIAGFGYSKQCLSCVIDTALHYGTLKKYGRNLPDTTFMYYNWTKSKNDIYPSARTTMIIDTVVLSVVYDIDCQTEYILPKIYIVQNNLGPEGLLDLKVIPNKKWEKFSNTSLFGKICREILSEK